MQRPFYFYAQFDAGVNLYNEKFGRPAKEAMDKLKTDGKLTATPFDEKIEWTFYELWHHEGRRARHGFYEVAKHFYTKFIPELKELEPKLASKILAMEEHRWKKGLSKEDIAKTLEFYKERYKQ